MVETIFIKSKNISKRIVLFFIVIAIFVFSACGQATENPASDILSSALSSGEKQNTEGSLENNDRFAYLSVDIDQNKFSNQTIIYSAWGRFTQEGYAEKEMVRRQCCYITVNLNAVNNKYYTDLNMILVLTDELKVFPIDEIAITDFSRIVVGSLNAVDLDGDRLDEIVLNYACGNEATVTKIFKITDNKPDLIFDFFESNYTQSGLAKLLGYSVRFLKNKKCEIINSFSTLRHEIDLSQIYTEDSFDKSNELKLKDDYRDVYIEDITECIVYTDNKNEYLCFKSMLTLNNSYLATVMTTIRMTEDHKLVVSNASVVKEIWRDGSVIDG